MNNCVNELFLLTTNLSQLQNKELVKKLFLESLNSIFLNGEFTWDEEEESKHPKEHHVIICTRNKSFGKLTFNSRLMAEAESYAMIQNAAKILAVILEKIDSDELLLDQKNKLQKFVDEQTKDLIASRDEIKSITENSPDIIQRFDRQARHLFVNSHVYSITGIKPDEFIGKTHKELGFNKVQSDYWENKIEEVFETKVMLETDFEFQHDDKTIIFNLRLIPEFDGSGEVATVLSIARDITESKKHEAKLIDSERNIKETHKIAHLGNWELNHISNKLIWSEGIFEIFEIKETDFVATYEAFLNSIHPEDRDFVNNAYKESLLNKIPYEISHRLKMNDGRIKWVNEICRTEFDDKGNPIRSIGIVQDITERKQYELALKESEERYKRITSGLTDYFYTVKIKDGNVFETIHNEACLTVTGYSSQDFNNDPYLWINMVFPEDRDWVAAISSKILNGSDVPPIEHRIICKDGKVKWINHTHIPHFNSKGEIDSYDGLIKDITERMYIKEALQENENKMRLIVEGTPYLFFYTQDPNAIVTYVSPSVERITGHSVEEWIGQSHWFATDNEINELAKIATRAHLRGEFTTGPVIVEIEHAKKHPVLLETYENPMIVNGIVVGVQGVAHDITERINAEAKVNNERNMLRTLIDHLPESVHIYIKDKQSRYVINNRSHLISLGLSRQEDAVGKTSLDFFKKENAEVYIADEQEVIRTGIPIIEKEEYSFNHQYPGERIHLTTKVPIRDLKGEVIGIVGMSNDITERKHSEIELDNYRHHLEDLVRTRTEELERANESLRSLVEKEKELSEIKSRFISTTSHEFRTPLTSILSSVELLKRLGVKWSDEKKNEHYNRIIGSVDYLTNLLDDILTLNRADSGKIIFNPEKINFYALVESCLTDARLLMTSAHELKYNYRSKHKEFFLDPKLMRFVFNNLLSNAIKFSPDGGIIDLNISVMKNKLLIKVSDHGLGIPKEELENIFDSFYRSKKVSAISGSGLGLAIVKRSVDLHNGEIVVKSELNKGTTFIVTLPLLSTAE
jgi:PAS domain S-box-containing protein